MAKWLNNLYRDMNNNQMDKIISLCKRRGFIYPGSEIYGGLAGVWDYGPLGVELKNNIKNSWWDYFVYKRDDMYGMDAAILMNAKAWEAAGHVAGFVDPLTECKNCHKRFRADHIGDTAEERNGWILPKKCPECGNPGAWTPVRQFNMMFRTFVGPVEDTAAQIYLRPETAQGMFVNFNNVIDSFHPKLPFGMAQIGKAFRNEITPKDFIFRTREFEQMEIEYFIKPPKGEEWLVDFNKWAECIKGWLENIGLKKGSIHKYDVPKSDLAHYSKKTIDFQYDYPFKRDELTGFAYRTDFDLMAHKITYYDEETKESFTPHVFEPSFGLDRTVLALLCEAYTEDEMNGEKRVFLKFKPNIAPVKAAVFPLLKNKPELVNKARKVHRELKDAIKQVVFDDNGNIGKRYRRQDEIGAPFCVTIDFDTVEDDTVTVRDRDTGKQERVKASMLASLLKKECGSP